MRALTLPSLNLSRPWYASHAGVGHREADLGLAGVDELQVVDGAAGHLGGGRQAGDVFRQDVGHAAAHRVVDAAGAAGRDRDPGGLLRGGRRREREAATAPQRRRAARAASAGLASKPPVEYRDGLRDRTPRRVARPGRREYYSKAARAARAQAAPDRSGRGALRSSTLTRVGNVAELAIEEVVAQRAADRAERHLLPRDLVLVEQPHFEALRARARNRGRRAARGTSCRPG